MGNCMWKSNFGGQLLFFPISLHHTHTHPVYQSWNVCDYVFFSPCIDFPLRYMVDDYEADIAGYNVTQCVHVQTPWPGDPVGETE